MAAPIFGTKLYQQRARKVLPLLVRQARAGTYIEYGQLAAELGIPNARNLNYVLGCIGQTMLHLAKQSGQKIPTIQCIVVNKSTGLPGAGIGWFLANSDEFKKMSHAAKRRLVKVNAEEVFAYERWGNVLRQLELSEATSTPTALVKKTAKSSYGGKGESDEHRKLKKHIATHPQLLNLPRHIQGIEEYDLPSGDSVDVVFTCGGALIGAEVKSFISSEVDITRGLFQCVKYRAVMEAYQASLSHERDVRVVLILEGSLPSKLIPLRNMLGIEVLENVTPEE